MHTPLYVSSAYLGDDVILQNGAVIGADGFGLCTRSRTARGPRLCSLVEPWSLQTAWRCRPTPALIGPVSARPVSAAGTKIDNLVQVGHGSTVGEHTLLCSQVGLAGSTERWQRRHSCRSGGSRRALQGRRWRNRHCAKRHSWRRGSGHQPSLVILRWTTANGYARVAVFNRLPEIDARTSRD